MRERGCRTFVTRVGMTEGIRHVAVTAEITGNGTQKRVNTEQE